MNIIFPDKQQLITDLIEKFEQLGITSAPGTIASSLISQVQDYAADVYSQLQEKFNYGIFANYNNEQLKELYQQYGMEYKYDQETKFIKQQIVSQTNQTIKDILPFSEIVEGKQILTNDYSIVVDINSFNNERQITEEEYNFLQSQKTIPQIRCLIQYQTDTMIPENSTFTLVDGAELIIKEGYDLKIAKKDNQLDICGLIGGIYSGVFGENQEINYSSLMLNDDTLKFIIKELSGNNLFDIRILKNQKFENSYEIIVIPQDLTKGQIQTSMIKNVVQKLIPSYTEVIVSEPSYYNINISIYGTQKPAYDYLVLKEDLEQYFKTNYSKIEIEKIINFIKKRNAFDGDITIKIDCFIENTDGSIIECGELMNDIILNQYEIVKFNNIEITAGA